MGHSNREFTRRLGDFSLTSIFPRWTSRFRCSLSTVRIKALQANEIPRFQMNSVRNSAGRQNRTPLDVKPLLPVATACHEENRKDNGTVSRTLARMLEFLDRVGERQTTPRSGMPRGWVRAVPPARLDNDGAAA